MYAGVSWQCVEYARIYLKNTRHVTFASVDHAFEIYDLNCLEDLTASNSYAHFLSFKNGGQTPPQVGDLLISEETSEDSHGHVSVVAGVDILNGFITVTEQNYMNEAWEKPSAYARKIPLSSIVNFEFYIFDKPSVIGWKRVGEFRKSNACPS